MLARSRGPQILMSVVVVLCLTPLTSAQEKYRVGVAVPYEDREIADKITKALPGVTIVKHPGGPMELSKSLGYGKVDFAIFSGDQIYKSPQLFGKPREGIRLAALNHRFLHLVTTPHSKLTKLNQIGGRVISIGPSGSSTETAMRHLLRAIGVSCERREVICKNVEFGKEAEALLGESIHLFGLLAGLPAQNVSKVGPGIVLLEVSKDVIADMNRYSNVYYSNMISLSHYRPGSSEKINTAVVIDYIATSAKTEPAGVLSLAESFKPKYPINVNQTYSVNKNAFKHLKSLKVHPLWFPGTSKLYLGKTTGEATGGEN